MKKLFLCFWLFLAVGVTNTAMGQFAGGSGTETDPYLISTSDHLVQLFYYLGNANLHFKMSNNIDLTNYLAVGGAGHNDGAGWLPIGNASNKFSGTFNGADFKITGLWINRSGTDYVGLFGNLDGANISNLGVEISSIGVSGNKYVGGLTGNCENTSIKNCYVTGNVSGKNWVGGLIGSQSGSISKCYATGNINMNGNYYCGGLLGTGMGTITDCYATGNVSGNSNQGSCGGLAGAAITGSINNCYATGNVTGNDYQNFHADGFGGLVGRLLGCNITNCYATGNVSSNRNAGGLVGILPQSGLNALIRNCYATGNVSATGDGYYDGNAGGLVGMQYFGTIKQCYAIGNVSGSKNIGGLIGSNTPYSNLSSSNINNCYATSGNIDGIDCIGGLIGNNGLYTTITNCYATDNISGNTNIGGFIGYNNSSSITNCFFDYQTSGQIYAIGGGYGGGSVTGKSTAEMKTKATFTSVDWDFTTIWGINEGVTYPFFINGTVGISELVQNVNIQLFPNPTTGELTITNRSPVRGKLSAANYELQITNVEIFDIYGKQLSSSTPFNFPARGGDLTSSSHHKIDISHLSAGVYFVKIYTEKGEVVRKVVKE